MMRRLGFGSKWIDWIRICLLLSTISILVNGSPTQEFLVSKGFIGWSTNTLYISYCGESLKWIDEWSRDKWVMHWGHGWGKGS